MVVCRKPLILGVDLLGASAVGALIAGVTLTVFAPLYRELQDLPRLRSELVAAHRQRAQRGARNDALQNTVNSYTDYLRDQARQPLANPATFLQKMSEECHAAGVELHDVQPVAEADVNEYCSWRVRVRGAAPFPHFERLLYRIESLSPFVHVDELLIEGPEDPQSNVCAVTWAIRVNYLPEWAEESGAQP